MNNDKSMEFVVDFVKYYQEYGILDKLNQQTQKMETSAGVYALVKRARELLPEALKPSEADAKMKALPEAERDKAIKSTTKVVDMRTEFSKRVAENGGARGLLADITKALESNDTGAFAQALKAAKDFTIVEETGVVPSDT